MHLPNVIKHFGQAMPLLLAFSASVAIRPAFAQPLKETTSSQTNIDFTTFPEASFSQKVSTVRQFQKYSTTAGALLLNRMSPSVNSPALAQAAPEVKSETLPPARPAILNLGSQQRWSFSAEALLLRRNVPNVDTAIDLGTGKVFGTENLDFNLEPGARFTLGYHPTPKTSFELSFFGLHYWNDSALFNSPTEELNIAFISNDLAINDLPDDAEDFTFALQQKVDYESRLTSVETNYRLELSPASRKSHTSLVAGLRYFNVDETLSLISFDNSTRLGGNVGRYAIDTNNNLIGLQIGLDSSTQITPGFGLGLKAKTGLLVNFANQNSQFINDGAIVSVYRADESRVGVSPMIELAGSAKLDLGSNLTLQAGYQFLFLGGVATAPAQFAKSPSFPSSLGRLERESVIYHGPFIGLEFRF